MILKLILLLISINRENLVEPFAVYTIVSAGKLVPNSIYIITLDVKGAEDTTELSTTILNTNEPENATLVSQNVTLALDDKRIIELKIGNWGPGDYRLILKGEGGCEFEHDAKLIIEPTATMILVQTDKAIYKAGQLVRFRVIIVDENLLPVTSNNVQVRIKDGNRNIVKLFSHITGVNGIYSGELQLSDQPVLGEWTIVVESSGKFHEKQITVAEYTLPAFGVSIKLPSFITSKSGGFPVTVKASYTYGKPVKGNMTFIVYESFWSDDKKRFVYKSDITGETTIMIENNDIIDSYFHGTKKFIFKALVTDSLSYRTLSSNETAFIYSDEYEFKLLQNGKSFKEGFSYKIIIKVSYRDGRPVENNGSAIKIKYGFDTLSKDYWHEQEMVPINGVVVVTLNTTYPSQRSITHVTSTTKIPRVTSKTKRSRAIVGNVKKRVARHSIRPYPYNRQARIYIDVDYKGNKWRVGSIKHASDAEFCFLQIDVKDQYLKTFHVGDTLEVTVSSVSKLRDLNYKIVGRKGIIESKSFNKTKKKKIDFNVTLTHSMTPTIRLFVYLICNERITSDFIELNVGGVFRNIVNISSNISDAEPGSGVNIHVNTMKNSTISLIGIDQRLLILKSGNIIEQKDVLHSLENNVGCNGLKTFASCTEDITSTSNVKHEFKNSGLIVFSSLIKEQPIIEFPGEILIKEWKTNVLKEDYSYIGGRTSSFSDHVGRLAGGETTTERFFATTTLSIVEETQKQADKQVRQIFPETWIWEQVQTNDKNSTDITSSLPDTITFWVLSAFSVNAESGLAIVDNTVSINVFRQFFVALLLPYSVIRGETVVINVTVYNYLKTEQEAVVTFRNEKNELHFNNSSNSTNAINATKKVIVLPDNGVTVSFLVTPTKMGHITIDVEAKCQMAGDRVIEKLLVKPEGVTQYGNVAMFVCLKKKQRTFNTTIKIDIPSNASFVPDSERVSVTAFTDILGSAINNLDDLLRMPYGCGEQNMINFVPNIVALNYLTKTRRITNKTKNTAVKHMETGYQKELTYKHVDGSYSAFGQSDAHGSTWLTAFVIKSFKQAKNHIHIDKHVISEGIEFLFRKQSPNGSFAEYGHVLSKAMQSGAAGNNAALTAYVLIALSYENDLNSEQIEKCQKSEQYLIEALENTRDVYQVAIITYALTLRNSKNQNSALEKLMSFAERSNQFLFWSFSPCLDVEINAYSLMTLTLSNETEKSLAVLRWLISKQNSNGGFESTQDTVIALQALALFAEKYSSKTTRTNVTVTTNENVQKSIEVDSKNGVILNEVLLSKTTRSLSINATGKGCTYLQVSWQYNKKHELSNNDFEIKYNTSLDFGRINKGNILRMDVCIRKVSQNDSGMAVMEATLPSGFTGDSPMLETKRSELLKRVELKELKTIVVFYFEKLTIKYTCVSLIGIRESRVLNLQPVPLTVYDYYDKLKASTTFYTL